MTERARSFRGEHYVAKLEGPGYALYPLSEKVGAQSRLLPDMLLGASSSAAENIVCAADLAYRRGVSEVLQAVRSGNWRDMAAFEDMAKHPPALPIRAKEL